MVFQDYALYPTMKGKGNLAYYFQVHQRSEAEAEQRTREVAEIMGVGFDLPDGARADDPLRRRAAAGRDWALHRARPEPLPDGRADLQSRRQAARKHAPRVEEAAPQFRDHLALRHARPAGSGLHGGPHRGHARWPDRAIGTFDDSTTRPPISTSPGSSGRRRSGSSPATIEDRRVCDRRCRVGRCRMSSPTRCLRVRCGSACGRKGGSLDAADGAVCPCGTSSASRPSARRYLFGRAGGHVNIVIAAPLDYPDGTEIRVSPDWERVYIFAADSEETMRAPGVLELF